MLVDVFFMSMKMFLSSSFFMKKNPMDLSVQSKLEINKIVKIRLNRSVKLIRSKIDQEISSCQLYN